MPTWEIAVISVSAAVLLVLVVLFFRHILYQRKVKAGEQKAQAQLTQATDSLADKFGGKDNIKAIQQAGSRVSVLLWDPSKVDKAGIQAVISNAMFMGNKVVFVIGSDSKKFQELLSAKTGSETEKRV